jgi:hypothetical protein
VGALGAAESLLLFVALDSLVCAHENNFVEGVTSQQRCGNKDAGYDPLQKPMVERRPVKTSIHISGMPNLELTDEDHAALVV